jgi:NAD(P)H dehydrogenase (quinone)
MEPIYLVAGATGPTGSFATRELRKSGARVRALVHKLDERAESLRRIGAEVFVGDLLDYGAVRSALQGITAAYFVYPIRTGLVDATAYFAQAALDAGLQAIVNMSQISARPDSKSNAARDHWICERFLIVAVSRPRICGRHSLRSSSSITAGARGSRRRGR